MTKSQLIERISRKLPHVPRCEVERIVNTVFDSMVEALKREDRIEIRGFGSFAVKVRKAREARNPRTGAKVHVPRRLTPYFTVGKELRDRLNPQRPGGDSEITDPRGEPVRAATPTAHELDAPSVLSPTAPAPACPPPPEEARGRAAFLQ
ncbi:MAG: integration host factor subunit beta [Myxococcaceae bacterium]|nr:integration host factor subunit beta [Myxococcaceae bacterium]